MVLKVRRFELKGFSLKDILIIPYRDFYLVARINDIMYIKAERAYCRVVLKSGEEYLFVSSLKVLLHKLPDYFVRIHNSYAINLYHTNSIHDKKTVKLHNDCELPISRRKMKNLFESVVIG